MAEETEQSGVFGTGPEDFSQAEWLSHVLEGTWRYDFSTKHWHHWNGVRWAEDKTSQILLTVADRAAAYLSGRPKGSDETWPRFDIPKVETEHQRKTLLKLFNLRPAGNALEALATFEGYGTSGEDWDQDPYLLGCENGIVDLRMNTLVTKPDPGCLVTKTTGRVFEPMANWAEAEDRAPRFMRFLDEIMSGDSAMVSFLILWFGASLFGFSPEQRFLLMTGVGRNGKGALKHSVIHAAGEYGAQPDGNVYMRSKLGGERSSSARADLIDLKGKRICFFSEPEGQRFNEEMLKAHTGSDFITARTLYSSKMLRWQATHSITFLVNDAPEVEDLGPSMSARTMVADFRERYEGANEDKQLYGKLELEADGILAIMCWAAQAWYASYSAGNGGITLPDRVVEQSRAFLQRNDVIAHCLNDAFDIAVGLSWQVSLCYQAYLQWHARSDEDGEPMSQVKFARGMEKKNFKKVKREAGLFYIGIKPKSAVTLAEEEEEGE